MCDMVLFLVVEGNVIIGLLFLFMEVLEIKLICLLMLL